MMDVAESLPHPPPLINLLGTETDERGKIGVGAAFGVFLRPGGGALAAASAVGSPGGNATLPPGFTVVSGDNVIIAEVFYDYVPWPISGVTSPTRLYHVALFRPRFGALNALQ